MVFGPVVKYSKNYACNYRKTNDRDGKKLTVIIVTFENHSTMCQFLFNSHNPKEINLITIAFVLLSYLCQNAFKRSLQDSLTAFCDIVAELNQVLITYSTLCF